MSVCVSWAFAISAYYAQNFSDLANFRCKAILRGCSLGVENTTLLLRRKKISTARSKFLGVPVSKIRLEDTTQGSRLHRKERQTRRHTVGRMSGDCVNCVAQLPTKMRHWTMLQEA